MKINFFTPLPPARTSIADHCARLLTALVQFADVEAWTDQDTWDAIDLPRLRISRFNLGTDPGKFHDADVNFYNIGNNYPFHGAIYEIARRVPGIVIIHDPNLGYFFGDVSRRADGRQRYLQFVTRHYGSDALAEVLRMFAGRARLEDLMLRYPMTDAAVLGSLGALVHQRALQQQLAQSSSLPVYFTALSHSTRDLVRVVPPGPPYRLVTFGYLGSNRRLEEIARAITELPERNDFIWDIYGTVQVPGLKRRLSKYHLGHRLVIHGYVKDDELDHGLARAHLAINLRNPTMGEASSSQLRIWEHGLPALVSRVGWYAEQPPDTLFYVDPGDEVAQVQQHLKVFLRDPARYEAAGRRGQQHLRDAHGIETYALSLARITEHGARLRTRNATLALARRGAAALEALGAGDDVKWLSTSLARTISAMVASDAKSETSRQPVERLDEARSA